MRSLSWGRRSQTDTRAERARPEDGAAESAPWDWFRNEVAVLGWRLRTDARAERASCLRTAPPSRRLGTGFGMRSLFWVGDRGRTRARSSRVLRTAPPSRRLGGGSVSAAAYRGDHVDPRARVEWRVESCALAIDVDVDVSAQGRAGAGLAQPVAQTGPALVEACEGLVHRSGLNLDSAGEVAEQRRQRVGQMQLGHGYSTTATSTEEMAGR